MSSLLNFFKFLCKTFPIFKYLIFGIIFLSIFEYVALSITFLLVENDNIIAENKFIKNFWEIIFNFLGINFGKEEILWVFIVLINLRVLLGFIFSNLTFYFSKTIHYFLNNKIYNEIINDISLLKIYKKTVGYYLQLAGDSSFKAGTIAVSSLDLIVGIISGIVSFYILYNFSLIFFLFSVFFFLACSFVYFFIIRFLLKTNQTSLNFSQLSGTIFIDSINNLRSIRSMKAENFVIDKHNYLMKSYTSLLFFLEFLRKLLKITPIIILLGLSIYYFYPDYSNKEYFSDTSFVFTLIVILTRVLTASGTVLISGIDFLTQFKFVENINELVDIFNKKKLNLKKKYLKKKILYF